MGLLDRFFGQGEQQGILPSGASGGQDQPGQPPQGQQGVAPESMWDRLRATYAPGASELHQRNLQQQAIYSAMVQSGAEPQIAKAMAMSPQFLAQGGEAYSKSPANVEWKQDPYTSQWGAYATGRGPGGEPYVREMGMGGGRAPGATTSPAQASQGGGDIPTQVKTAREGGADVDTLIKHFVPEGIQGKVRSLLSGKTLPDELKGQTAESVKNMVMLVDPEWNQAKAAGSNEWIKKYMGGDIRDNLQATNTSLEALNALVDKAAGLKNADVYNSYLSSGLNKVRQASGPEAVAANEFNTTNHALAQNLVKMMSGSKRPVSQATINDWKSRLGSGMRPVEMGGAMSSLVDEVDTRIKELEQERDARVGTPGDYPIKPPGYDQKIQLLRQKIEQLQGSKNNPGSPLDVLKGKEFNAQEAAPSGLPTGWSVK